MSARQHLHIGVFIPSASAAQLLDTACIDVFAISSYQYLSSMPMVPSHLSSLAPEIKISYIGSQKPGSLIKLTADMKIELSNHFSDGDVAPGKLDVVLVPGPDPRDTWDGDVLSWLRQQGATPGTDILSVCTGIYLCAAAGLADGRTVCGPRGLQSELRKKYPKANFVGEKLRWKWDGNFWSSGGVTNGNDLVAAYCRESGRFPGPVAEFACVMADVGDRPQLYEQSQGAYTVGIVWQLIKAWFLGVGKTKAKTA
ncbi:hypothetical protein N8I77_003872 [Diaporthe amygdali]|uniref:DJ-1/PfpI domain-containing protein n=1 Tax=Phomopsis amygdali TaxID=1214568 RepID=A0AAD9SKV5_PHOAM|nr:hypothetical protein N8I77_003872 [Diaporthe amygdali]